jgi:hypothetical protein
MARVRRDERFWRERVQQWDTSGLSVREFAAREGLRQERLIFWRRRLRTSAAIAVAGVSFAKVSVVATPAAEPTAGSLEVLTRSGHAVRVRGHFEESALLRLLSVLGGP